MSLLEQHLFLSLEIGNIILLLECLFSVQLLREFIWIRIISAIRFSQRIEKREKNRARPTSLLYQIIELTF